MLTIQPFNVVNHSNQKQVHFRGEQAATSFLDTDITEDLYKEKSEFYKSQIREFDNSINDENTPKFMKKILKGFRVISEALLEGWAVAWGAKKGANVIKSSVVKNVESSAGKHAKEIVTPFGEKLQKFGKKIGTFVSKNVERVKTSSFGVSFAEKLTNITNKMRENSVGKYVVEAFEYIGKGVKAVTDFIVKPFKGAKLGEVYDKAAKATSTTLGVGAGAAGAYNATSKVNGENNTEREISDYDADENYDLDDDEV